MLAGSDFRWLLDRLEPMRMRIVLGLLCVSFAGIAATIDPLMMRSLIDRALPQGDLRLAMELARNEAAADEALLTLADFMIVLREVDYQPAGGSLSRKAFDDVFQLFLGELAEKLERLIEPHVDRISTEVMNFWKRVVKRCQE